MVLSAEEIVPISTTLKHVSFYDRPCGGKNGLCARMSPKLSAILGGHPSVQFVQLRNTTDLLVWHSLPHALLEKLYVGEEKYVLMPCCPSFPFLMSVVVC